MPVQFDTFSQGKIDSLKTHLEAAATKGRPKSFEIWVDGLQVIPRTEEPSEFDNYEEYLTADSNQVKVVIYCTDKTNRNDKYIFQLKAKNPQEAIDMGIAGLPLKTFNSRELDHWRQKQQVTSEQNRQIGDLRDDIDGLNELLEEKQKYIEQLEGLVQEAKANGNKLGGIDLGQAITAGLEGLVRNTTQYWAQVPGLAGVAQAIEADSKPRHVDQANISEAEVTFKKKSDSTEGVLLTDEEKGMLNFIKQLQRRFSQAEMEQVIHILDLLSKDKKELAAVQDYLQEDDEEQTQNN